jgi:hypothetical protein
MRRCHRQRSLPNNTKAALIQINVDCRPNPPCLASRSTESRLGRISPPPADGGEVADVPIPDQRSIREGQALGAQRAAAVEKERAERSRGLICIKAGNPLPVILLGCPREGWQLLGHKGSHSLIDSRGCDRV